MMNMTVFEKIESVALYWLPGYFVSLLSMLLQQLPCCKTRSILCARFYTVKIKLGSVNEGYVMQQYILLLL